MSDKEKKPIELASQSASVMNSGVVGNTPQTQYNIGIDDLQSLYSEVNGKKGDSKLTNRSFASRKRKSKVLVSSFFRLSNEYKSLSDKGYSSEQIKSEFGIIPGLGSRGSHVASCGDHLEFRIPFNGGKWKLHHANFCHDRLCPMCMARRSLKIYSQLNQMLNYIDSSEYIFLFLTVTVPNCSGEDLDSVCDRILKSFTRMTRRKELKSILKGYFRSLEVTFNHNLYSKSYKTFHPHLHAILAVPKSYFKTYYIKQSEWLRMWQESYGDDSIQFVNIKKVNAADAEMSECADIVSIALHKAIAETGKYSVKASDYLFDKDDDMTDYAVKHISRALYHKQLFAFGGIFEDASRALNLEDVMSDKSDLLHINADDVINKELAYYLVKFHWGGNLYKVLSFEIIDSES